MQKYGDLLKCDKNDTNYWEKKILCIIEEDGITDFHSIWDKLVSKENHSNINSILYKNAQILLPPDFECTVFDKYNIMLGRNIESLHWKNTDQFLENLLYYKNYLKNYKEDVVISLNYNRKLKMRKGKNSERDRFNDTACYGDTQDDNLKYDLPFELEANKYDDFCAYTWKALFKDTNSIECFKNNSGKRAYVNTKSLSRIKYTLTCAENICPTDCDRWLIEKIFATSTMIALLPTVIEYYDKRVMADVIIPAMNTILMCKPVKIRIALADLVCKFLQELPSIDEISPYNDPQNNKVYAKETVEMMIDNLKSVIEVINKSYIGILAAFYKTIESERVKFEHSEGIPVVMKKDMPQVYVTELDWITDDRDGDIRKRETDWMVNGLFFNQIGLTEIMGEFSKYPQKRNYNSSDPLWRFATLQSAALDTNYRLYHNKE